MADLIAHALVKFFLLSAKFCVAMGAFSLAASFVFTRDKRDA